MAGTPMKKFLDPQYWSAVARNPAAIIGLVADLAPIIAVIFWGWGAAALIMLYWIENVVIGAYTVPRMIIASVGRHGPLGLIGCIFGVPFFVFHYGMFCAVHGTFLLVLFRTQEPVIANPDMLVMLERLFMGSLSFAQHMNWIVALVVASHGAVFIFDFLLKGGWKESTFDQEMGAPYGRVVILHLGIFVIGGALMLLGDPTIGALFLVLARAALGLHINMQPKKKPVEAIPAAPAAAASLML
ncbi:MAG TPA: DUF6498-containing protein [Hyphomonadaceae bacterium]|nr:DUF6498-containing protein [Hyphomonadaceae bacterium]